MSQYDPKLVDEMMRYENGEMENLPEEVALFQKLINSGIVWQLQGFYGRRAQQLIDMKVCSRPAPLPVKKEQHLVLGLSPEDAWLEAALHIGRHIAYYALTDRSFGEQEAVTIRHVCYRIVGGAGVDTHDPATRRRINSLINRAATQAWMESPTWKQPAPISGGESEH